MTAQAPTTRAPPVIGVELANAANTRLLERLLGSSYQLCHTLSRLSRSPDTADLIIVDGHALGRCGDFVRELQNRDSTRILPVLLVADHRVGTHPRLTAELGQSVDDILRIPTSRAELLARIENLLRIRRLSQEQEEARQQLASVVSALRTLNACDTIIVRSRTEEELLEAICRTIADKDQYNLAWIGFGEKDDEATIDIRASAGLAVDFTQDLKRSWLENNAKISSAKRTLQSGSTQIISDIAQEIPAATIRDEALARGLKAAITLPLVTSTGPNGCLAIYSATAQPFSEEEKQLLERLAENLTFGINALRMQHDRKKQAEEIHTLAYTDALTGLPNRRHLLQFMDAPLGDGEGTTTQAALLFIDLDGFKLINDALGHDVGDQVLIQIGQRLQAAVRDSDMVVRQGGDEFIVVIFNEPRRGEADNPDDFLNHAQTLVDRIIDHLHEPLMAGGHTHHLTASVGISLCPDHTHDAHQLIENADKAMFVAKAKGGGHSHLYSEEVAEQRHHRFSMEARLREALEKEEFTLHYQPIFELDSRRIIATEALIRWPQADGEILMPGAFMPLIEETGLIQPLGDWVLGTASRQLKAWRERGMTLSMAVNLSVNQLFPNGTADGLAGAIDPDVPPSAIHLEVTENALMKDSDRIEALLKDLNDRGFRLAVDDFGTGYSSLSRLQHLPIHTLKIDRSFVNELSHPGSKGSALVAIIQQMATRLELETIAEGIETEAQLRSLQELGGRLGQGFWFSRAVPPEALETQYRKYNQD